MKKTFNKIEDKWYEVNENGQYSMVKDDELIQELEISLLKQDMEEAGYEFSETPVSEALSEFVKNLKNQKLIDGLKELGAIHG